MALSKDELNDLNAALRQQALLQQKVNESSVEYLTLIKDIKQLHKSIKTVQEQMAKQADKVAKAKADRLALSVTATAAEKKAADDLLQTEKAILSFLTKQNKKMVSNAKAMATVAKEASKFSKSMVVINDVKNDVIGIGSYVKKSYNQFKSWSGLFDIDKSIRMSALSMGLLSKRSDDFRTTLKSAGNETISFGVGIGELAKLQADYSEELGRSLVMNKSNLEAIAAMSVASNLGAEGTAKMAADMDVQGYSAKRTSEFVEQTMTDASNMGLNATKVMKNIQSNIKLLNKYNFKDGVKGLAKMAESAAKLGVDMNLAGSMSDKLFDIDGAVEMSSQLQVMGGEWSKLADPFKLMYMARNDMEGLTKSVTDAAASTARFNTKSKEFEISALEMHKLRKVAEQTGLNYEELAGSAKKAAKFANIRKQISFGYDEGTKEFIENTAEFENGEAVIQLKNGPKLLKQLNDLDKSELEAAAREKKNLKERAEASQTFDESLINLVNQFKQILYPFIDALDTGLRPAIKTFGEVLKNPMLLSAINKTAEIAAKALSVVGGFVAEHPGVAMIGAITGIGLFEAGKWYLNGLALGTGFNTVAKAGGAGAGGGFGTRNMAAMSRAGMSTMGKFGANFKGALGSTGAIAGGVLSGGVAGVDEYLEQKEKGKSTSEAIGRGLLKGAGSGVGAWGGAAAGASLGAFGGPLAPITVPLGALVGGGLGALGGGKAFDLDTWGVQDGVFGGTKNRAIMQGGKITPIDNKDDLLAMKSGGVIEKTFAKKESPGIVKHEFGELKINGSIVVSTPGGGSVSINLLKDPEFIRNLTQKIQLELGIHKNQVQKG